MEGQWLCELAQPSLSVVGSDPPFAWQIYHWNEKRKIGEYYQTLAIMQAQKEQEAGGES